MRVTCGCYALSSYFHRQCHLLAEFALCANHLTSVSEIHVPHQMFCFSLLEKKEKKEKKITSLASVLKGYLFVLVSVYKRPFPFAHEINEDVFIHL